MTLNKAYEQLPMLAVGQQVVGLRRIRHPLRGQRGDNCPANGRVKATLTMQTFPRNGSVHGSNSWCCVLCIVTKRKSWCLRIFMRGDARYVRR